MTWYDSVARLLTTGSGLVGFDGAPTAAWPPGYPVLLALIYTIFGPSLLAAKLCNALLGTATVLVTFLIAREVNRPRAGLLAGAMLALFPGHVLFSPPIVSEALFGLLFCVALWLFLRWNNRPREEMTRWFVFGAFLGVMSLVRGIALTLLPAFALTWLTEGAPVRAVVKNTAAAASGILIVLVPWVVRNQVMLGYPILIASDGPMAVWIGHSAVATGGQASPQNPSIPAFWNERFGPYLKLPNPQAEVAIARAETREVLADVFSHPGRVVALIPPKVYYMYSDDLGAVPWIEAGLLKLLGADGMRRLCSVINAYYFVVLALALFGLRHFRPSEGHGAVVLPMTVAWLTFVHAVIFFGDNRYHFPLLPIFSIMAATGLKSIIEGGLNPARSLFSLAGAATRG
jgi:4-amino-4-deoxy-L-arabinose transferase-like glycosyltransferase